MRYEMIPSPNLVKILNTYFPEVISKILDEVTMTILAIIQSEGFCPVDTTNLRQGHRPALNQQLTKYIVNSVAYWIYVVYGHRVAGLITDRQRKFFFAKYGNEGYTPKTDGFVPPNDYLFDAVTAGFRNGYVQQVVDSEVRAWLRG